MKSIFFVLISAVSLFVSQGGLNAETFNVSIEGSAFTPQDLTIQVGDSVIWTQLDPMEHTVTSGLDGEHDGVFDSGFLSQNQTFTHTFSNAGTFPYFCSPHPFMTGTITVQGDGTVPPTVAIVSPANNTTYPAPTNITIEANAAATDATIVGVEFFNGTNSLGLVTGSPFRVTAPFPAGAHTLTARATDSNGSTATSAAINVTVQGAGTRITNAFTQRIVKGDLTIELQPVATGMASPLGIACPDDGSGRLFVYDQAGYVYVVQNGVRLPTPLLDVRSRLVNLGNYDERGLLGLATHPSFSANPYIYTYTSETNGPMADFMLMGVTVNHQSVITEWRIDAGNPNAIDPSSRREILRIDQPQSNHNGGALRFGPDGYLYISLGDGGSADDQGNGHSPGGNGQDRNNIYGTIVRINVDGRSSANGQYSVPADNPFVGREGLDEIYAWGFRNPYTFSFDRQTGELYVADVGQNQVEEVNRVFNGGNYGWPIKEGGFFFDQNAGQAGFITTAPTRSVPHDLVDPIAQYDHDDGLAIVSGYVYRGSKIPGMQGRYLSGDWGTFSTPTGRLYYLDGAELKELRIGVAGRPLALWLKGFGEDTEGELYICGSTNLGPNGTSGVLYKIVPVNPPVTLSSANVSGGQFNVSWQNGVGPFVTQSKDVLCAPLWQNTAVATGTSASTPAAGQQFVRVADMAGNLPIPFTVHLTGDAERPSPVTTAGIGSGILRLEGNTLHFNLRYSGLGSAAVAAHIHGPAGVSETAPPIVDLASYNGGAWGQSGVLFGAVTLTPQQKAYLLEGRAYINIHTVNNGGGEIRGQVAPVVFTCTLDGASERPQPINTPATGSGIFLLAGNQLTLNLSYRDLTSTATAAHIHGPASTSQTASPVVDLGGMHVGTFATRGAFSGTTTLTPQQLSWLLEGRLYINVHSVSHSPGEIRGQLMARSTAVPLSAAMSGDAERPNPVATSGTGSGSMFLEGNSLHFELSYNGLSAAAFAAHIHGPADTGVPAGVLIDLGSFNNGEFGTRGAFSGRVGLTDTQRLLLLQARTYVNVHTSQHSAGEIRGQSTPCLMHATLLGASVRPDSVLTSGGGSANFLLVDKRLHVNASFAKLGSAATNLTIFGAAKTHETAPVLVSLSSLSSTLGTSGGVAGSVLLGTNRWPVIDGNSYISVSTDVRPNGEIRGQLQR